MSIELIVEKNLDCVVRDGTVLRADVYRPAGLEDLPTLVCRTPYGKTREICVGFATSLASKGYCVVMQDQRGRNASDGEYRWIWMDRDATGDHLDGYDTVEWAARLPWSSGNVGAFGHSNDGWSVWTLAAQQPPSLRAASAAGISPNTRDFTLGFFETGRRLQWIHRMAMDERRREVGIDDSLDETVAEQMWHGVERGKYLWWLPLSTLPDSAFAGLHQAFLELLESSHCEFMSLGDLHSKINVPMLLLTGWWDRMVRTVDHVPGLLANSDVSVRGEHRLIVGPWGHSAASLPRSHAPFDFGPAAEGDYSTILAEWFDKHLKNARSDSLPTRVVRYFVIGDNEWRDGDTWPPHKLTTAEAYLDSDGEANTTAGNGRLLVGSAPAGADADTYMYDPKDPVMSLLDINCEVVPIDQTPRGARNDVLVYDSEPIHDRLDLVGPVEFVLWAASSAPDTDWFVTLAIVYPDGLTLNISYGACRARYRRGFDNPVLLTPGIPEEYRIHLQPIACVLQDGQRLRLYLTSSDFPNFDRNHNVGRDDWKDSELAIAHQTIFHSQVMPSRLILPTHANA